MELIDVIKKRKSVRRFSDKPVPDLSEIIMLSKKGPSAGAIRAFEVIATGQKVISYYDAPIYLVVCVNQNSYHKRYGERGSDLYAIQDSAIVAAYLQLLLTDIGLSSCWVGSFNERRVARIINTNLRPIAVLAVGYGGDENEEIIKGKKIGED